MEPFVIGLRFQKIGKIYHFDATNFKEIQVGDFAVVETSRGKQLGEVIQILSDPQKPPEGTWKSISRIASGRDLVMRQLWQKKETEAVINGRAKIAEQGIQGVKIVDAEYTFDGSRLTLLYSTETEDAKVDLRRFRAAIRRIYPRARVDLRQIGPRDVAKILGGMGACGLETRCCSKFLTEFSPISIKMAKEQGISLTPSEITGMCGRLRCCLIYEYQQYVDARKELPKRNKRVITPEGEGKVVDVYPLKSTITVEMENGIIKEFDQLDVQPAEEFEAFRKKSQEPCSKNENGGCDCGNNKLKTDGTPLEDRSE